jgi:hypothetical protein
MASSLRVNAIVPASGTNVAIGTAGGTITYAASVSGVSTFTTVSATTVTATTITGVATAGITTAYIGSVNDGPLSGFRNKIINGDMRVDQRNNGASVSVTGDGFGNRQFPVDRFNIQKNSTCVISGIQTSDVPTGQGFSNALRAQVTTADATIAAGDYASISHRFEGYNVADLHYGTTNAKTATLSFWVKSSISGTYCVALTNYADSRAIPINYSINSPDTWEYKTITISGDTTGTWEKTNSGGMNMAWTLGAGTDYQATNNTWTGSVELATSSQTQWISTLNATFFITGVQLESGTVATPFERRSFGQELALCERYYQIKEYNGGTVNMYPGSTNGYFSIPLSPLMRTGPSVVTYDTAYQASGFIYYNGGSTAVTYGNNQAPTVGAVSSAASRTSGNFSTGEVCGHTYVRIRASAEL